ncbi:MAG: hypothetical protein KKD74_08735 [Bacteroidetes bacterium]|nr:hypothetical protein [Bacteroidota bacterium]
MRIFLKTSFLFLFLAIGFNTFAQKQSQTYESAMASADQSFAGKDYLTAKTYYEMAIRLKANDAVAQKKLNETILLLGQQMEKQEVFYNQIDAADKLYKNTRLEEALAAYLEALTVMPKDTYAQTQVDKIRQQLKTNKENLERFDAAIAKGNMLTEKSRLEEALFQYREAAKIMPDSELPKVKIKELEALLSKQKAKEDEFAGLQQKARELIARKDYTSAAKYYEQALALYPDDQPTINAYSETVKLRDKSSAYEEALAKADALYAEKDFRKASVLYERAAAIWPEQSYPSDMIRRINDLVSDKQYIDNETYQQTIAKADKLIAAQQFTEARDEYAYAIKLKPEDSYAKEKLNEVEKLLKAMESEEAREKQYNDLIGAAALALQQQKPEEALQQYRSALALKPGEKLPAEKIAEIEARQAIAAKARADAMKFDALLTEARSQAAEYHFTEAIAAYEQALQMQPENKDIKVSINALKLQAADASRLAAAEKLFLETTTATTELISNGNWEAAKASNLKALGMKPDQADLAELQKMIEERITAIALSKASRAKYDETIKQADKLFGDGSLAEAKTAYQQAAMMQASENYPVAQLALIESRLETQRLAKEKEARIGELMTMAEGFFENLQWTNADSSCRLILAIDQTNVYALNKVPAIAAARQESERQNNLRYQESILKADNLFSGRDYKEAITAYKTARSFKTGDAYAERQILVSDSILRDQLLKQKTVYDQLIAETDKLYNAKAYDKAIDGYVKANQVKSDESYPLEMIARITRTIEENKLVVLNETPVALANNTDKRFEFLPVNTSERRSNYILIKAKNTGKNNFSLIVSYGSSTGKNGGFVLPIPASAEYKDYIVRIGSQYKWFSEDNVWINFYPENGDVEVSLIQISKGN